MIRPSKLLPTLIFSAQFLACSQTQFRPAIKEEVSRKYQANHSLFVAGRKANDDMSFSFLPTSVLQTLKMDTKDPQSSSYIQVDRPIIKDEYVQGHLGNEVKEDFPVSTLDKIDLLVVVDDSSSMKPFQEELSSGLKPLLTHISNADWNIMVTTTSWTRKRNPLNPSEIIVNYGCPRINSDDAQDKAILTRKDYVANPTKIDELFSWKVLAGEAGNPIERGVLAAVSGMQGECGDAARSWTRPESNRAVLMLTDEENCGSDPDQNCDTSEDSKPEYYLNTLGEKTKFFALLYDRDKNPECPEQDYVRKPDDYRALVDATGGIEGNICVNSYDSTLEQISKNLVPVARKDFVLAFEPDAGILTLEVDGVPWTGSYKISGKDLLLETPLPQGSKILSVRYRHDAVPLSRRFPFSKIPDSSTLEVFLDKVPVSPSDFSVDKQELIFKTEPKELSRIVMSYREKKDLPKVFNIPIDALLDSIKVYVDGTLTTNVQIVGETTRDVVFEEAPRDKALVEITYETEATRTLRYTAMTFEAGEVSRVSAQDPSSGENFNVKIEGSEVVFQRADVARNRLVHITYEVLPKQNEISLQLARTPIEGSLNVQASESGAACVSQMSLTGNQIRFPCPSRDLGRLSVTYDYISAIDNSFRVPGTFSYRSEWIVKIDGIETKDYQRDGNTISFPQKTFAPSTLVEVEVWEYVVTPVP